MGEIPGLVGRAGLLDALTARLESARAGRGSLVLLAGEAGIGKTALCDALVAAATDRGLRVGWTACWQAPVVPGLWPWTQLLRQLGRDAVLAADRLDRDAALARQDQFEAVARTLGEAARDQPLLLVFDDVHWADAASLALLGHVATTLRTAPITVVATYRPGDAAAPTPLGQVLAHLRRTGHELTVAPLPPDSVRELLVQVLGRDVEDAGAARIADVTGGNPLFVLELARSGSADDVVQPGTQPPALPSVVSLLTERMAALSPRCRQLLDTAAVAGDETSVGVLCGVLAAEPADVITLLTEAVDAGVVRERAGGDYEFAHPLFRAAVYDQLGTARRAELHAATGDALLRLREAGVAVELAALAHHFGRSAPLGNAQRAVTYATEAGVEAMRTLAYETAARRFQQALAAVDVEPAAGDRVELLLALADAHAASGQLDRARESYDRAAVLSRDTSRAVDFARAVLGRSGGTGIEVTVGDPSLVALLTEALALLPDDAGAMRALVAARLCVASAGTGDVAWRSSLAEQALGWAEDANDPTATAHAIVAWCHVKSGPAHVLERERQSARVVEIARTVGDIRLELLGRRLRVEALLEAGRLHDAAYEVDAYANSAQRVRDPVYQFYEPLWRAALASVTRDSAAFAEHRAALMDLVRAVPEAANPTLLALVQQLFTSIDDGLPQTARDAFDALTGTPNIGLEPQVAVTAALLLAVEGRRDEARALVATAGGIRTMVPDAEWLPSLVQLADIAELIGSHELAEWAYQELAPYEEVWAIEGIGAAVRGPAARARAILAGVLGDAAAARQHADHAHTLVRAAGARRWEPDLIAAGEPQGAVSARPEERPARWSREGELWRVEYDGIVAHVRDSKGMRDLAQLLASPGEEFSALGLSAGAGPMVFADALPALDEEARRAYRERLAQIDEELDRADTSGDAAHSARLTDERRAITAELARAFGLGGRPRPTGASAERARTTVTTRIRDALRKLEAVHPNAAAHLRRAVRTGAYCAYDPDRPMPWHVTDT